MSELTEAAVAEDTASEIHESVQSPSLVSRADTLREDMNNSADGDCRASDHAVPAEVSPPIAPTASNFYTCRLCRTPLFRPEELFEGQGEGEHREKRLNTMGSHKTRRPFKNKGGGGVAVLALSCNSFFLSPHTTSASDLISRSNESPKDQRAEEREVDVGGVLEEGINSYNSELEGKVLCPKASCRGRIGIYNWAGAQCSCGVWVTPAIQLTKSKIDPPFRKISLPEEKDPLTLASISLDEPEREGQLETDSTVEEQKAGIRESAHSTVSSTLLEQVLSSPNLSHFPCELAKIYSKAFLVKDFEVLERCLSETVVFRSPKGLLRGKESSMKLLKMGRAKLSDREGNVTAPSIAGADKAKVQFSFGTVVLEDRLTIRGKVVVEIERMRV